MQNPMIKKSKLSDSVGGQKFLHLADKVKRFVSGTERMSKKLVTKKAAHRGLIEEKHNLQQKVNELKKRISQYESEREQTDQRVTTMISELDKLNVSD